MSRSTSGRCCSALSWFVREEARDVADEELTRSEELAADLADRLDHLDRIESGGDVAARLELLRADIAGLAARVEALEASWRGA